MIDRVTNLGDNRQHTPSPKKANGAADSGSITKGTPRVEFSNYFDGSTRLIQNVPGLITVYDSETEAPVTAIGQGVWQEFTDQNVLGRSWAETPDTIDKEGPSLRLAFSYDNTNDHNIFELKAFDLSGIDQPSLDAWLYGTNYIANITSYFHYNGSGVWSANFASPPVYDSPKPPVNVKFSLTDKVGNLSTFNFPLVNLLGQPQILSVQPACVKNGKTIMKWKEPEGNKPDDILYYEIRQLWEISNGTGIQTGAWQSVGKANSVKLDLPAELTRSSRYFVEIRAVDQNGSSGAIGRSIELHPSLWSGNELQYMTGGGQMELTLVIPQLTSRFALTLPAGWTYISDTSNASIKPQPNSQGVIKWQWSNPTTEFDYSFIISIDYAAGLQRTQTFQGYSLSNGNVSTDYPGLIFIIDTHILSVNSNGGNTIFVGSSTGHGGLTNYQTNIVDQTNVQLQAPECIGTGTLRKKFEKWTGDIASDNQSILIVMDSYKTVNANYMAAPINTCPEGKFFPWTIFLPVIIHEVQ